jgi:hypothetical protein
VTTAFPWPQATPEKKGAKYILGKYILLTKCTSENTYHLEYDTFKIFKVCVLYFGLMKQPGNTQIKHYLYGYLSQ